MSRTAYKELCRRLQRLPLDLTSLRRLQSVVKTRVRTARRPEDVPRLLRTVARQCDSLVEHERWSEFPQLLDVVWKQQQPWVHQFHHTSYVQLKPWWPQVHIVDEFGTDEGKQRYYDELAKHEVGDLAFLTRKPVPSDLPVFTMIRQYSPEQSPYKKMVEECQRLFKFCERHSGQLGIKRKLMLEAVYVTDQYGLPLNPLHRNKTLSLRVKEMRQLTRERVPVAKSDLEVLKRVALYKQEEFSPDLSINPNFFKYMARKKAHEAQHLSPKVSKVLRTKWWAPSEHNIRKWYRGYVRSQFYVEDGQYVMSDFTNFFENENSVEAKVWGEE
ncbi:hypothetical protein DICA0_D13674 [Diutina catenulata]